MKPFVPSERLTRALAFDRDVTQSQISERVITALTMFARRCLYSGVASLYIIKQDSVSACLWSGFIQPDIKTSLSLSMPQVLNEGSLLASEIREWVQQTSPVHDLWYLTVTEDRHVKMHIRS